MTYQRLAYEDQDTAVKMHLDCTACASQMGLPEQRTPLLLDAPVEFDELPRETRKPEITVSEAAAHLAARLHLHLD